MDTPASGIVRTAHTEHRCTDCRGVLTNVTRYPGPLMYRCLNRACPQCALPKV